MAKIRTTFDLYDRAAYCIDTPRRARTPHGSLILGNDYYFTLYIPVNPTCVVYAQVSTLRSVVGDSDRSDFWRYDLFHLFICFFYYYFVF